MRKHLLLFIGTIILGGCKLDDSGFPKATDNLLLGKWYDKIATTYIPPQNGNLLSYTIDNNYTPSDYLSFDANTVIFSMTGLAPSTINYVLKGSVLTLTSITDLTDIETQTIKKLTADSLVLESTSVFIVGGVTSTATVTTHYSHK